MRFIDNKNFMSIDRIITSSKIIANISLSDLFGQQPENFKSWPSVINAGKFGWMVYLRGSENVFLLDESLRPVKSFPITISDKMYSSYVNISPDGRLLAVITEEQLSIYNVDGEKSCELSFNNWDTFDGSSCVFTDDNLLWFAQPGTKPGIYDRITAFDPIAQTTVAETAISTRRGYFSFIPSPMGNGMFIEVACDQDGVFLYYATLTQNTLSITDLQLPFRILAGESSFSPNRKHFITAPHSIRDTLQVHDVVTSKLVTSIEFSELIRRNNLDRIDECEHFGLFAIFLSDNRILVDEWDSGEYLLLDYPTMHIIGRVAFSIRTGEKSNESTKLLFGDKSHPDKGRKPWMCGIDTHRNLLVMTMNRELILYETAFFSNCVDECQLPLFDQPSLFDSKSNSV